MAHILDGSKIEFARRLKELFLIDSVYKDEK
jgi:hypothetical protein